MSQYLDFTGLQTLWGRIKEYAKITTTSGTTKVVIGANEVTIPNGISPYDSAPEMDGTASAGNSSLFARGNHVHPKDTTKADKATTLSGYGITDAKIDNGTITLGSNTITPLTSFTESDPTVPSWAKQSSKPSYTASEVGAVATTAVGAASGVCPLDSGGKVASTYLPGYVDDVVEAYPRSGQTELSQNWLSTTSGGSALTPETGKIYVLLAASTNYAVNSEFRWGGSTYVQLNDGGLTPMTTSEIETATPLT
jgi:hypothetical protein